MHSTAVKNTIVLTVLPIFLFIPGFPTHIQTALGSLATKAGQYVNGVYDWASQATGFDAQGASAAVQEKGSEWATALDLRVEAAAQAMGDLLGDAAGSVPAVGDSQGVVQSLATFLKQAAVNPSMRLQTEEAVGALLVGGLTLAAAKSLLAPSMGDGAAPAAYDGAMIDAYYKARPGKVLARLAAALSDSSGFLGGLLLDYVAGNGAATAPKRAKQLTRLITELGPVFIKVGQLISVRPDIVSPAYLKELQQLQDQVKAFSSKEARALIAANLPKGTKLEDVYEDPERDFKEPVAAASLGQVYRAVMKDGSVVAVKVQRPRCVPVLVRVGTSRMIIIQELPTHDSPRPYTHTLSLPQNSLTQQNARDHHAGPLLRPTRHEHRLEGRQRAHQAAVQELHQRDRQLGLPLHRGAGLRAGGGQLQAVRAGHGGERAREREHHRAARL